MDGYLILEFQTHAEAETALHIINEIAASWWISQGYTVIEQDNIKQLVGKKSGMDNPDAARTLTWDTVKESPNGTFYIASPTNSPNFVNWRDHIPEGVVITEDSILATANRIENA